MSLRQPLAALVLVGLVALAALLLVGHLLTRAPGAQRQASAEHRLDLQDADGRRIAATAEPKSLWMIEGAAHTDFQAVDPVGYRERVIGFLLQHLQPRQESAP